VLMPCTRDSSDAACWPRWLRRPAASAQAPSPTPITALMAEEPYRRRIPVFAGDDVTDEDGFTAVEAMGGIALRVDSTFGGQPQRVHAWLAGEIGMHGVAVA